MDPLEVRWYSLKNSLLESVKEGDVREKLEDLQGVIPHFAPKSLRSPVLLSGGLSSFGGHGRVRHLGYRGDNSGKFPTVCHAMQEVGGSYYVVNKIIQELQYNSKLPSSNAGNEVSSEAEVKNSYLSSGLKNNVEKAREKERNKCIQQPFLDVSSSKKSEDAKEETHCESVPNVDNS
ncbi:hypothetical protein AgCh_006702 [Apium graveolens]